MKNQHIFRRGQYALQGLKESLRSERSFRAQVMTFACVVILLLVTRPAPVWWALLLLTSAGMMATELINTAVERLVDHVHPDQHAVIGIVKDTLSAAVFMMCSAGVAVMAAFLWTLIAR